ncbi:MAG: protein translocase subunit SecD [Nocardioidaceae bacterium]|nr:protein translocase subunit SecD [Nocardioidaceae bacterium]
MFAAAAAVGNWKPRLGLDLQGGTRITLQAKSAGGAITTAKLQEAVGIISNRVNGAGVAEAEVTTQGEDIIVIEIPGKVNKGLAETIGSTAQLRFRLVAAYLPPEGTPAPTPTASTPTSPAQTTGSQSPGSQPSSSSNPSSPSTPTQSGPKVSPEPGTTKPSPSKTPSKNRVGPVYADDHAAPAPTSTTRSPSPTDATTTEPSPTDATTTEPSPTDATGTEAAPSEPPPTEPTTAGPPTALVPPDLEQIDDPYAWIASPPQEWQLKLAQYTCPKPGKASQQQVDLPSQPLLACDEQGGRYLLGPAMVEGTEVKTASSGIPQQGLGEYVVNVEFTGEGSKEFGAVTSQIASQPNPLTGQQQQLAIVLDGVVLSAPSNDQPITGGRAEISGGSTNPFTQQSSTSLANSLKYGALPLTFVPQQISDEGPELAGNQLRAGITAGIIGLLLVVVYCLLYYRGLGLVVIASLVIAGLLTYASVLLLGKAYGFTLTLPGIAGLIVAVGITADSFIVYFERLRDEVRDGRTLRTSVETGWVRARTTILAADAVSMLAAIVLFIFAIGVVKGFAFALGLTTFIDVFVVFFFTKPMVTFLSRTKFFGQGHKWSGLDRQHLGMPPLAPKARVARGEA